MSVSHSDRPVGEGESRTAHTHAGEESDNGVVPMKQPNKSGKPQRGQAEAEAVEGSPLAKENAAQPNAGRTTEPGNRVQRVESRAPGGAERKAASCLLLRALVWRHHPRPEPYAVVPHVRICAGGEQQCSSLPRPELRCANPYLKSIHQPDQAPVAAAFGSGPGFLALNRRPNWGFSRLTNSA